MGDVQKIGEFSEKLADDAHGRSALNPYSRAAAACVVGIGISFGLGTTIAVTAP
jgi:hypothetical protein